MVTSFDNERSPLGKASTAGMAIASLVLGILSPFTCGLTMIPAIICGKIGLRRIKESNGLLTGQWQIITGVVFSLMGPFMLAGILMPQMGAPREKQRREQCILNEKQLALAYLNYLNTHDNRCPKTLDDLKMFGVTEQIFHCPSARDQSAPSYLLICGTGPGDVIIRENPSDHYGLGGCVAYGDGHVKWVSAQPQIPDTNY